MKVRVADLAPEGLRIETPLEVEPLRSEAGEEIPVRDVTLAGRVIRTSRGLQFTGRLLGRAKVPCARCLVSFELALDREMDLHYSFNPPPGRDLQIPSDEMDMEFLDESGELDLAWMAAEQFYLEIPMKPLCQPSCRGLCTCCGADLNRESCRKADLISRS